MLTGTFQAAKNMIGAALAPTLTSLMNRIAPMIAKTGHWIKENKHMIVTMAILAAKATLFGGAIMLAGGVLVGFTTVMSSIAAIPGYDRLSGG